MVARLTNSSARFFLSLVLSRSVETSLTQAEFAIRPERGGFVPSITPPPAPVQVQTTQQNMEKVHETHIVEGDTKRPAPSDSQSVLVPPEYRAPSVRMVSEQGEVGDELVAPDTRSSSSEHKAVPTDPLELCRRADKNANRSEQVSALIACWDEAFPVEEYEFTRLSVRAARELLTGDRTAEFIGDMILRAGERSAREKLEWPLKYVKTALAGEEERMRVRTGGDEGEEVPDEIKNWTKIALAQWRKQNENRSTDQSRA